MIDSRGKEILRYFSHACKGEDAFVSVDRPIGVRKERQVFRHERVHIDASSHKVPRPSRVRRDDCGRADDPLRLAYPFVVAEDEGPVLADRASGSGAELVALVRRFRLVTGIGEEVIRIQLIVAQELVEVAMECVRSRFADGVDHSAGGSPVLG